MGCGASQPAAPARAGAGVSASAPRNGGDQVVPSAVRFPALTPRQTCPPSAPTPRTPPTSLTRQQFVARPRMCAVAPNNARTAWLGSCGGGGRHFVLEDREGKGVGEGVPGGAKILYANGEMLSPSRCTPPAGCPEKCSRSDPPLIAACF